MFFLMKKNWWLFFLFIFSFPFVYSRHCERGWVVLLDGTSSAGKTSVARELMKMLNEKYKSMNFQYESRDNFLTRQEQAALEAEKNKKKSASSAKITSTKSASKSISISLEDSNENDDDDYDESLTDYFEYLDGIVAEGRSVVADTVLRDEQDLKDCFAILKKKKIFYVLVYCPIVEVVERVEWRNRSGNQDEERTLHQVIDQVPDMFTISHRPSSADLDSITKRELDDVLKKLEQELKALNKKNKAIGKDQKNVAEIIRSMRRRYGFSKRHNKVYIRQKFIHDVVVINSKTIPLVASAKKIGEAFDKRVFGKEKTPQTCSLESKRCYSIALPR